MAGKKNVSEKSVSLVLDGRTGATLPKSIDLPDAPTIGAATKSGANASVAFTPSSTGGTPVSYKASAYISGVLTSPLKSGTGTTSPISVTGLTTGTAYTFKVAAINTTGSMTSAASNSVTM